jgi:hypothetical protein
VRVATRQLENDAQQLATELRAMLRPATTAAPAPRRDRRTPGRRSPPAGR